MEEITPKERAEKLFWDCFPQDLDNGRFMKGCWAKKYAKMICDSAIAEAMEEYTNDENHVRVEHWREVKKEIENIKL